MPIQYMTLVDGWAHTRWGTGGMLLTEALVGLAAVLVFLGVAVAPRISVLQAPWHRRP